MARDTKTTETTVEKAPPERTFTVATLRGNCVKLFGCTSSTFDGAFYGQDTSAKISIADANKKIKAWLGKEIK